MGMDVYGNVDTKPGDYFRNNCWWWRPLAKYVTANCPEIAGACKNWHTNDGDGLGARGSKRLASALQKLIDSGHTKQWEKDRATALKALPMQTCEICKGSGKRNDPIVKGTCNACGGKGKVEHPETWYHFSADNVQDFVKFLEACEGFKIC